MNKILIITNKEDITVDYVVNKLNSLSADYYRFNTEEIGTSLDIKLDFSDNKFYLFDTIKNINIDFNEFDSIYFRRPKLPFIDNDLTEGEKKFLTKEYTALLEGVYRILDNKKWLNNVYDIRHVENKIYQLLCAGELGFKIPSSLITNISKEAHTFSEKFSDVIFKPMKNGFIEESKRNSKILYTTLVDDFFLKNLDRIKPCPCYFQEHIEKKYDVRVTYINKICYSASIYSQSYETSKTDWRKTDFILQHERIDIPEPIREKCVLLCNKFNLNFAAIDFIVDQSGDYWLLEINPNGQWAWIEEILKYPITSNIIDYLIK